MPETSVSTFFDSYASDFDAIYGNRNNALNSYVNRAFRKSMMLRFEKTIRGCDPIEGRTVIDVGCGPGHYGIALAKRGAASVWGVDFADGMIDLARRNAERQGVAEACRFSRGDFLSDDIGGRFDYAVVMGFMDYIAEPRRVIDKVMGLTASRAFFSFPVAGGFLGWQRKLRYKKRCDLFLYTEDQLRSLFAHLPAGSVEIEKISRDFFVTARAS